MKNPFNILSLEKLKNNLITILSRFPITAAIIFITSFLFFLAVHSDFTKVIENNIYISIFSLIITYFFSVGTYLTCENLKFPASKKNLFQLIPIAF